MVWLAVCKNGNEYMFHNKPVRNLEWGGWCDKKFYDEYRACNTSAEDGSIRLPKGTIKKLIGEDLTWKDEPIELKEE